MFELFQGIYEPIPSLDGYLERIGYDGPRETTEQVLADVMWCAMKSIPFENTCAFENHQPPSIDIPDLYDKIVTRKRGGYCFELNGLLMAALEALGFECYACPSRVNFDDELLRHKVIIVKLDGKKYFVDTGLAGPVPTAPMLLEEGIVQASSGGEFRWVVEKDETGTADLWCCEKLKDGELQLRTVIFEDKPWPLHYFRLLNQYCATSLDNSVMTAWYIYALYTEDGHLNIFNNEFTEKKGDVVTKRPISNEEIPAVLLEKYGLDVTA